MAARINIPIEALTSRLNLSSRFESVRGQSIANRFSNLKPLSEFFDIKRMSKPANFGEAQSRVNYNLGYFSSNYAVVFVMLCIYSLITNRLLFFVIFLVVGGMWGIGRLGGRDLDVGFFRATTTQLYTGLLVIAVPLGLFASPFGTVLWLIGASGVTILGHAALLEKDVASQFSEEAQTAGRKGRPPGASRGVHDIRNSMRGGYQDWEPRQPIHPFARLDDSRRFVEELADSDEEDDGQGVHLNGRNGAVALATTGRQRPMHADSAFASDELYFTGYDLSQARPGYGYDGQVPGSVGQYQDNGHDHYYEEPQSAVSYPTKTPDNDEALVQSALVQIAKAKARGVTSVDLSQEEINALERRRAPNPSPTTSSPGTPTSSKQSKRPTSRSASDTSLSSQKGGKKAGSGSKSPSPASPTNKSNSKAKLVARKPTPQEQQQHQRSFATTSSTPVPLGTPGIMVEGPDGVPVFQPIGPLSTPSPNVLRRPATRTSRPSSRSASRSRHDKTSPAAAAAGNYGQWPQHYHTGRAMGKPVTSSSKGSSSSTRSASNEHHLERQNVAPARRIVSNEADYYFNRHNAVSGSRNAHPDAVAYSPLRRVPAGLGRQSLSPQLQRVPARDESDNTEDDDNEEEGEDDVEVLIDPGQRSGAGSDGHPVNRSPLSGGGGRRRKGWVRR
ncbi:PRA1-domain-containing protein [Polychaeton citri CBS 116435]|uniref:PRA1-domain-containing protein n=1 Tax=Polychaeton citri CBS 116435 TaxID=1314669 RepID=A0A9P4QHA9_9PEZI|nr:PRA1-domain-containing protein [Polychaeton citri CBS 116435]